MSGRGGDTGELNGNRFIIFKHLVTHLAATAPVVVARAFKPAIAHKRTATSSSETKAIMSIASRVPFVRVSSANGYGSA